MERVLLRGICVFFIAVALVSFASASTTVTVVPTGGVSASPTIKSNICPNAMWNCVNDPVGMPDYDSTYVYKDETGTSGEHVVSFSGNITQITGITMHIIAATNGGVGTAQMLFYNNGTIAGTGGAKTLSGTYTEYVSGPFNTQISDIANLTMKVVLTNTSGTGSLKYTAIWMDVTYGACNGICPPPTANKFSSIEEMLPDYSGSYNPCTSQDGSPGDGGTSVSTFQNWITQRDCGTNGTKTGNTQYLSSSPVSPALPPGSENPPVRRFSLTSASQLGAGMRWFIKLATGAGGDAYTNFLYDTWVYFPNDGSLNDAQVMEMDINHNSEDQLRLYLIGVQCNLHTGLWQVTKYGTGWINTSQSCTRSQFTAGAWHHVQIKSRRDTSLDKIVYEQAAVDGVVVDFLCGGASCQSDWRPGSGFGAGTLGPNFQINAERNGAVVNIYADTFAIYRW